MLEKHLQNSKVNSCFVIIITGILFLGVLEATAVTPPKPGAECKKLGLTQMLINVKYTCIKSGKKLVWNKGVPVAKPSTPPTPTSNKTSAPISSLAPTSNPSPQLSPTDSLSIRISSLLETSGASIGIVVQEIGENRIADFQSNFVFDPASSIKPLIALYAFKQISTGALHLGSQVPAIISTDAHGCPSTVTSGSESLESALREMLQQSDNNRTVELELFFGVKAINSFAKSIGLLNTSLKENTAPPGFVPIGCIDATSVTVNPMSAGGNTSSLNDLVKLWISINSFTTPYREDYFRLFAGREMYETQGYDFTGIWPQTINIVRQEAPSNLSEAEIARFISLMNSHSKGGSNALCFKTPNCSTVRWWVSMTSLTSIPSCSTNGTIKMKTFVWSYFVANADSNSTIYETSNPALKGFISTGAEPLREQIRQALSNWNSCK